ncbi:unnamed protein product [Brassica oleracea var. botrytis]
MSKVSVVKILPLMEKGMEIRIRMLVDRRVIKNQKWKFLIFMMQRSLKRVNGSKINQSCLGVYGCFRLNANSELLSASQTRSC